MVVDAGTAITLDVIAADGAYIGGTIAPGMELSLDSLFSRTAKLPQIALEARDGIQGRHDKGHTVRGGLRHRRRVDTLLRGVFAQRTGGSDAGVVARSHGRTCRDTGALGYRPERSTSGYDRGSQDNL